MKITLDRASFAAALAAVTPAAAKPGSGHLTVLTGVRIDVTEERVALTCSNLDLTISTELGAPIYDEVGVCVVPAQLLARIVRATKADTVALEHNDGQLTVKAGRARTTVRCFPVEEWPRIEPCDGEHRTISREQLPVLAEAAAFASTDTARPILNGVHFGNSHVDATDSFAAYQADLDLGDDVDVLVPAEVIALLVKAGAGADIDAVIGDRMASFTADGVTYTTRLIEGQFPNVAQFTRDTSPHHVTVDVDEFVAAIREVTPLVGPATPVRLTTVDNRLVVEVIDQDVGSSSTEVDCDGALPDLIAFNPQYLTLACAQLTGRVTFGVETSLKPVVVNDERAHRILMPVRVK